MELTANKWEIYRGCQGESRARYVKQPEWVHCVVIWAKHFACLLRAHDGNYIGRWCRMLMQWRYCHTHSSLEDEERSGTADMWEKSYFSVAVEKLLSNEVKTTFWIKTACIMWKMGTSKKSFIKRNNRSSVKELVRKSVPAIWMRESKSCQSTGKCCGLSCAKPVWCV